MAMLAEAPTQQHASSWLFGNNFRVDPLLRYQQQQQQQLLLQQQSIGCQYASEVLEIYSQFGYAHKKMIKKEVVQHQKLMTHGFRSHTDPSYQQHRSTTVDWLCQVGEACQLASLTIHTAIGFMDMFLDVVPIDGSRLRLVAAATMLIAAKIEEQEHMVPRVATLLGYCQMPSVPPSFVPKVESLVLNHLQWEMVILTPCHFLEYYLLVALQPSELVMGNYHLQASGYNGSREFLVNMAEFLVDLCEHHSLYREYLPSIVAASAIALARQMMKVTPVWSQPLQLISTHSVADISQCVASIWGHYRQTFAPLS